MSSESHSARTRAYLAVSLDGYIADANGSVAWLDAFMDPEMDFPGFMSGIGASVMGRRTYDQAAGWGRDAWQYGKDDRVIVLTRRPIEDPLPGVRAWSGELRELMSGLRAAVAASGKDIWLMGGGESLRSLHEAGLVDRWELSLIPTLLGRGVPLFPERTGHATDLVLVGSRPYANGVIELHYEPV